MDGRYVVSSLLSRIKWHKKKKKKKEDIYDPIIVTFAGLDTTFVNRYTLYTYHPTSTTRKWKGEEYIIEQWVDLIRNDQTQS